MSPCLRMPDKPISRRMAKNFVEVFSDLDKVDEKFQLTSPRGLSRAQLFVPRSGIHYKV